MKKYIVPMIMVQNIELSDMIAASPEFTPSTTTDLPTLGTSSEKTEAGGPGNEAEGLSKSFNAWDAWD